MTTRFPRFDTPEQLHQWANRKRHPPRVMSPSEYIALEEQEHFALVKWRDLMSGQIPELRWLFHVPNGEFRHKGTAIKLAKMGVLPGIADFLWLVPRGRYHGMVLELKAHGGVLSLDQDAFLAFACGHGYFGSCAYGWHNASTVILNYYEGGV